MSYRTGVKKVGSWAGNNDDLRLRNIKKEDELFFKHKIFIETVNSSKSGKEAARRLSLPLEVMMKKAYYLRSLGALGLKTFHLTVEEVSKLKKIAAATAPKKTVFDEKREMIIAWNKMPSIKEFAEKFGMTRYEARKWGGGLRAQGYDLKKFYASGPEKWARR